MNRLLKMLFGDFLWFVFNDWLYTVQGHKKRETLRRAAFYATIIPPNALCYDVGANVGNRIYPLLHLGAKVVAIEPQPSCNKVLKYLFGNTITLVDKGLASTDGVLDFYIANSSTISSFSIEWIQKVNQSRFKNYSWKAPVKLPVTTLDWVISQHGSPYFIKIDVEGYEAEVLKGLSLPVPVISFEYTVPEQTDKLLECLKLLQKLHEKYLSNYSIGESMQFAQNEWIDIEKMINFVCTPEFQNTYFGDIYVKLTH